MPAFTVAKSAGFDILSDLHSALNQALAEGQSFGTFAKNISPILQQKGWWGKKEVLNPATGKKELVQLGSRRRLQIIYDTNLRIAHAVGKWEKIKAVADSRPYLRYSAILDNRTRPLHRYWHGTILRWNHPWWDTHYPPCGWHCRCSIIQLDEDDLKNHGFSLTENPPDNGERIWRDKNGQAHSVPNGIDPGFAYHKGKAADQALAILEQKVAAAPAELKEAGNKLAALSKENNDQVLGEKVKRILGANYNRLLSDLKEALPQGFDNLLEHEAVALRHYTELGYDQVAGALRDGKNREKFEPLIEAISKALKKLPIYRGMVFRDVEFTEDQIAKIIPGSTFVDKSFASTTKLFENRPAQDRNVLLVIKSRSGRDIEAFSSFRETEREVLFLPEIKFRIKKVTRTPSKVGVYLEEIEDETN